MVPLPQPSVTSRPTKNESAHMHAPKISASDASVVGLTIFR